MSTRHHHRPWRVHQTSSQPLACPPDIMTDPGVSTRPHHSPWRVHQTSSQTLACPPDLITNPGVSTRHQDMPWRVHQTSSQTLACPTDIKICPGVSTRHHHRPWRVHQTSIYARFLHFRCQSSVKPIIVTFDTVVTTENSYLTMVSYHIFNMYHHIARSMQGIYGLLTVPPPPPSIAITI